ncbi:hypothetical protein OIU85_008294 [Salix viminalis]|uniref:Uncharacterized protein n=1 Tax=Salix viminalis TaxID=40686 RepID=A0A9Q0SI56_SALVM|nr:hypothetical protein OIU85_008294 [Salix viminalis]
MKSRLPLRLPAPSPPIGDLESQRNNILDAKPDLEKELGKTLLTWCFTAALQIATRSKQVAESEIDNSISLLALVGSEGAISDRSPPASLDNGSFNENDMIIASDAVNSADHGIQTGVEAHEQDEGEQNSNGVPENFIYHMTKENLETNDVEPVGFSDSNFSVNFSNFIVPTAPCLDIEEVGGDSSHLNARRKKRRRTSEVWKYFEEVTENGEERNKKAETELYFAFKT